MCSCLSFCQPQTARRGTNYRPDSAGEGVVTANALNAMLDKLATIVTANVELENFHRHRAATLGS